MQINNYLTDPQVGGPQRTQPAAVPARRSGSAATPVRESAAHTPDPELAQWVARAGQAEDLRHDVVAEVAGRIASGEYLTQATAERVADAMLKDPVLGA
jgi:anti-sigma28 factor (negative regulator of flagellin synthesis)